MKAIEYVLVWRGEPQPPLTATKIAEYMKLPRSVVSMRLQRGERDVDYLRRPVGVYGGNDGHRKLDWHERRQIRRAAEWADREEQQRIAAAEDALADL